MIYGVAVNDKYRMSTTLESLFNLPPAPKPSDAAPAATPEESLAKSEETKTNLAEINAAIDKIDLALPTVRDLDASDAEMDALAQLAQDTFTDMIDYGMNVDPRVSGQIFQSASTLLGHALTAKMAKMDKKLKMVDLQLKKARLDQATNNKAPADVIEGKGTMLDRNELMRTILADATKKINK
jgi:hypothetical protein